MIYLKLHKLTWLLSLKIYNNSRKILILGKNSWIIV